MERMRTMLFCPASQPKMYINAPIFKPDCILFDLEDSVAFEEKDSARDLLCMAIQMLDFGESRICVRVNSIRTPFWKDDVKGVVKAGVRFIRLSTCESVEDVETLDYFLTKTEEGEGLQKGSVKIQCSIETAKGVLNAAKAIKASSRIISLSFGAEDYTRTMGTKRSRGGFELIYARSFLPVLAAEAGISAIDTVWSDLKDMEGFKREVQTAKSLGFTGKSCIHPSQIKPIHEGFMPSREEIKHAEKIVGEVNKMRAAGEGVFVVDGKMIDEPVINKAKKVISMTRKSEI